GRCSSCRRSALERSSVSRLVGLHPSAGSRYAGGMSTRTILGLLALSTFLAGSVAGCGGRDWQGENAQLQADLDEARRDLSRTQAHLEELRGQNEQLRGLLEARGADLSDMAALREQLQRDLAAAREREEA